MKGDNLLEWKTFRLNNPLKNGDVVGCGWVRGEEGVKGIVYFTLNGDRLPHEFQEAPAEMLPFLHIQKKVKIGHHYCSYSHVIPHASSNLLSFTEVQVLWGGERLPGICCLPVHFN